MTYEWMDTIASGSEVRGMFEVGLRGPCLRVWKVTCGVSEMWTPRGGGWTGAMCDSRGVMLATASTIQKPTPPLPVRGVRCD